MGGGTLHVILDVLARERSPGFLQVRKIDLVRFLIAFISRQRPLEDQARQSLQHLLIGDIPIIIIYLVPVVDSQRLVVIVQIAYEVIEHLVLVQVVVVDTDVIQVDRTALATDHDILRNLLLEIILRRILRRPGHDAVDIDVYQTV